MIETLDLPPRESLLALLHTHFGYTEFRPFQWEAMSDLMAGRDSVVVLPTGGGKSLCYQVPAIAKPGLAVVISPLIALMKDQVDALVDSGIAAAAVNSTHSPQERMQTAADIRSGKLKLLYVSPEKISTPQMIAFLREQTLSLIAVDEAHCISNWGHDFRPEYRLLGNLREEFPDVSWHAFTATATEQVRQDIARQLRLRSAVFHVGDFDRPNLVYRVQRRDSVLTQIEEVLARHPQEAGIIYAITRKEVEAITAALVKSGRRAAAYHAGLDNEVRRKNQEAFLREETDIVVATTAFGMGIDKSNVRFVIHAAAPRSIESYQQESGRAGRDGLEAECCMFYSAADFHTWRRLQSDLSGEAATLANEHLRIIERFCGAVGCRHKALVEHFGQSYAAASCGACDVCLDQLQCVDDPLILAQKILSCVLRVNENFGADYVVQVLLGSKEQRILENRHEQLSTYGLLASENKKSVRDWVEQLVGQEFLGRDGEFRTLYVTETGREVLRGQQTPRLLKPADRSRERTSSSRVERSMEGVDSGLFAAMRQLRRQLAEAKNIPPFIVFGDVTLQDICRRRPASIEAFQQVHGVGAKKCDDYGEAFITAVIAYCTEHDLALDVPQETAGAKPPPPRHAPLTKATVNPRAEAMLREGKSIAEVAAAIGVTESTVAKHLAEYLKQTESCDASP